MNARQASSFVVLAVLAALAACGGGGSTGSKITTSGLPPTNPTVPQGAQAIGYGANIQRGAVYVGPAQFAAMGLDVAVNLQNESGLETYAREVSDPSSGLYRRYLTPQEIGQRFGASASNYTSAANYFTSHNLHVGGWPQRLSLFVSGRQSDLEAAFGTRFGIYTYNGQKFVAPMSAPSLPAGIPVRAAVNIVRAQGSTRDFVPSIGDGNTYGYSPQQLRKVFDYQSAYAAGYNGAGITVAIIGTGPIDTNDVPAYGTTFGTNVATVTQVNATDQGVEQALALYSPSLPPFNYSTGLTTPPPVTGWCAFAGDYTTCNEEDGEAQLDTQQVAGLAPGATVHFYLAYNNGECYQPGPNAPNAGTCPSPGPNYGATSFQALGIQLSDDEIQQIIADNTADVVSGSYGGGEPQYGEGNLYDATTKQGLGPSEFAALAAEGIAAFFSTGDSGAEGCLRYGTPGPLTNALCVGYPSTDVNVTAVGAVTTPMDAQGNLTSALTGWGVATSGGGPQFGNFGFGASGGGCSIDFTAPSYQQVTGGVTSVQSLCSGMRANPDVSLEGDLATGVFVMENVGLSGGATTSFYGGTSVAAPETAAMWALVLQACKQTTSCATASGGHPWRLGNANPYFYAIYNNKTIGSFTPHLSYDQVFYDVLYGFNGMAVVSPFPSPTPGNGLDPGYNAGPGFDLITGIGVPYARHLIQAVVGV